MQFTWIFLIFLLLFLAVGVVCSHVSVFRKKEVSFFLNNFLFLIDLFY